MSNNVETAAAEAQPGAYFVAQRAAGSYPAWARQAPAGQTPASTRGAAGLQTGQGSPSTSVIDAECHVIPSSNGAVAGRSSQSAQQGGDRELPTRRTSRRDQLRSIGFTVVGQGGSARILPFDAQMMSNRRLVTTPSVESIRSETSQNPWSCSLCSYENADPTSITCSVCGSSRSAHGHSRTQPALTEPVPVAPLNEVDRRSKVSSNVSREGSKGRCHMEPIGEHKQAPHADLDGVPGRRMKKSGSFKELMGMSFAKWSHGDNGPWACASCTYVNPEPLHLTCEVCGQPRLKDEDRQNEINDAFFNSSFGSGVALCMEDQDKAFQDLEESMIERERMEELIEQQGRILTEMRQDNKRGRLQSSNSGGSVDGTSNLNDCRLEVEDTKQQLRKVRKELERVIENERQEIETVEKVQRQRRAEIESEEGVSLADYATPDNVNRTASPAVLDWMAQQRMLDDWKLQRASREEQLEDVRRQEERVFEMYEGLTN